MTSSHPSGSQAVVQHMAVINRLNLKAFNSKTAESLIFTIVNDTVQGVRYDRAVLFDMEGSRPKILGISGQAEVNKDARLTKEWEALARNIKEPSKAKMLTLESFEPAAGDTWNQYQETKTSTVLWVPIMFEDQLVLGLWLDVFTDIHKKETIDDTLSFVTTYLTPAYGVAWNRFRKKVTLKKLGFGKEQLAICICGALLFLFIVQVPIRVVAPCEIIANNPVLITAPLEGIVEDVLVEPGQIVQKDDVLFEYDKRVPLRNLEVAQKEVEILEEEVNRARTLGLNDKRSLTELAVLELKLDKEKVNLELSKWQASQLSQKAPSPGVIVMFNPDEWRGKPVQVGEKVMSIDDPNSTKVRIWIPEADNIVLDREKPVKIFLNVSPEKSYNATIQYISNESVLNDASVPSFIADALWVEQPHDIKLGLEGTAVLYGENVSLFYFLIRRPWATVRHMVGV